MDAHEKRSPLPRRRAAPRAGSPHSHLSLTLFLESFPEGLEGSEAWRPVAAVTGMHSHCREQ